MSVTCYIGLGSNLGDRAANLHSALASLARIENTSLYGVSRFYASPPMGPADQPDYANAVACLHTNLSPHELLNTLFTLERNHGRVRNPHARWGPRTLDLDLLLYGNVRLATSDLQLPHPGICERVFVAVPLAELAPRLLLPDGCKLSTCVAKLADAPLKPWRF